jgi:hypothetical protein
VRETVYSWSMLIPTVSTIRWKIPEVELLFIYILQHVRPLQLVYASPYSQSHQSKYPEVDLLYRQLQHVRETLYSGKDIKQEDCA